MLTGGITFSSKISTDPYNIEQLKLQYVLSGMALKEKSSSVYDLWLEILTTTKFDTSDEVLEKLSVLIKTWDKTKSIILLIAVILMRLL